MGRIYVGDNKNFVWQWQPKEQIVLEGYPEGVYVHYANCDTVEAPVVQSRMEGDKLVADIPPELMQSDKDITVYVCDEYGTKHCHFLSVLSRPKPESYVTEPVEVLRYETLAERVKKLEEEGTGVTPGAAPTIKVEQTEDGATITATDSNGTTTATIRNGKDGADGIDGKDGADAKLPADLFEGCDRFYYSIAQGRVNPDAPLDIATYDGSGQLTHPCVRHFPGGFGGHSWWMAASPYAYSDTGLENPCVWYSDDGIHWSADGIPNPLALPPTEGGAVVGYNSDPHLLLREDGVMEVWWRTLYESGGNAGYEVIFRRTSADGISWTEPEELHREQGDAKMLLCPVAIREDGVFKIWVVRQQEGLRYYESADGTAWQHIRDIDVSNPDYPEYKVWHFDVNHTAKGFEFVGNYCIPGDFSSHKYLYYAVSDDNITYSKRVMILTRGEAGSFDERLVYRPSIVRLEDRVRIYYGAQSAEMTWSIGLIEAPSAYLFNAVLISGSRIKGIESGQEWLDGRVTALEAQGGGGSDRPADDGVTVVRSFDESPWLPGYWDPNNDGALTLYSNMHRTQLVELASLTVDGELPEITAKSSMAAWALVRFNYFDGNLRWIGADMGAFIDPGAGTQEPTVLRWPAGAVYVAISANTADKGAITVSGVPEGGDCEISEEQIREIAEVAAGMVEVPGGGGSGGSSAVWAKLGEVTLEEAVNKAIFEIPDNITELIFVITNYGGDTEAQDYGVLAWAHSDSLGVYRVGKTSTNTLNARAIARVRKIQVDGGTSYVDLISAEPANGVGASASGNGLMGNKLTEVTGNYVGIRKDATAHKLPVGFSFYVLGR